METHVVQNVGADLQPAVRSAIANPGSRSLGWDWAGPLAREPLRNLVVQVQVVRGTGLWTAVSEKLALPGLAGNSVDGLTYGLE